MIQSISPRLGVPLAGALGAIVAGCFMVGAAWAGTPECEPEEIRAMTEAERTIRAMYDLFSQGHIAETMELVGDDVTIFEPGSPDILPWAGVHQGREAFARFNEILGESLSSVEFVDVSFEYIGQGRVVVTGTERGVAAATGRLYETASLWIWTVRGGEIVAMRAWHDTEAMAAAFR